MVANLSQKLAAKLMAPSKPTPENKAVARRLGLETPQGVTAFMSQFKSSYPANTTERLDHLYPEVKEELISKLSEKRMNE